MGWIKKATVGLGLSALLSAACTPGLPAPLATFPTTVDIVNLGVTLPEEGSSVRFGWPATAKNPKGKHSRRLVVESATGPRTVTIDCDYEFTESTCSRIEMRCNSDPGGLPFTLILSSDGTLDFNGSTIGTGDNERHWALVEMNANEREGKEFRATAPRAVKLGPEVLEPESCDWKDRGDRTHWAAQLVWSQPDEESSGEMIRAQRVGTPDREFNLLSTDRGQVYASVHQAHPEYGAVLATLATAGNLWAKNTGSFKRCPAPATSNCAK